MALPLLKNKDTPSGCDPDTLIDASRNVHLNLVIPRSRSRPLLFVEVLYHPPHGLIYATKARR